MYRVRISPQLYHMYEYVARNIIAVHRRPPGIKYCSVRNHTLFFFIVLNVLKCKKNTMF